MLGRLTPFSVFAAAMSTCGADAQAPPYAAASAKQLFVDKALIARMHRVTLAVNRPTPEALPPTPEVAAEITFAVYESLQALGGAARRHG